MKKKKEKKKINRGQSLKIAEVQGGLFLYLLLKFA